jgi:Rrf2 family protein
MSKLVSMSEAASIAIHGVILIARAHESLNVQQIAELTGTSKHHVAKIMQRLVKEGYLSSLRGPAGGFRLVRPAEEISFLNLYESIEGKIEAPDCPMDKKICPFDKCIMNNISSRMTSEFRNYLSKQIIADYQK